MIIAPSVLSADYSNLEKSLEKVNSTKWLHVDVMDGHFVPNIALGPVIVKGIRKASSQILDTHLMISDPFKYIVPYVEAGSDRITFHIETVDNPLALIREIRKHNIKVGISIKPKTEVECLTPLISKIDQVLVMSVEPGFGGQSFIESTYEKIVKLDLLREELNPNLIIVVDGGVNDKNAQKLKEIGVDVLVAGSFIFNSDNPYQKIESLR